MRRRRPAVAEVSLFAFQDVMASVIGILFFIVLLMAMTIVEEPSNDSGQAGVARKKELEERARALAERVESARARLEARRHAAAHKGDVPRTVDDVRALDGTLRELLTAIERAEVTASERESALLNMELRRSELAAKVSDDEAVLKALEDSARSARSGPRVAYILDASGQQSRETWLVELSGTGVVAIAKDGSSVVIRFGTDTVEEQRKRFVEWASGKDMRGGHFVLLIKPSATPWSDDLEKALDAASLSFGTDLLPEAWRPFE